MTKVYLAVAGSLFAVVALTTPAHAASPTPQNGVCEPGELCLWYFSGQQGSFVDLYWGANDLAEKVFLSPGAGRGTVVANNAESARNYDTRQTALLCTEAYHVGNCQSIPPNSTRDLLPGFKNNVESTEWVS
jgi:hypothetical protein